MGDIRKKAISIIHYQRRKGASWIEYKVSKDTNLSIEVFPLSPGNAECVPCLGDVIDHSHSSQMITLVRDNFELPVYDARIPGLVNSVRESLEEVLYEGDTEGWLR